MPTGYTAKLFEGEQSFEDFAMQCARAMGACIMMRDEPAGTPIPERFTPSDYNEKAAIESRVDQERLSSMSQDERKEYGQLKRGEAIRQAKDYLDKQITTDSRLRDMESAATNWQPPTADHQGLKDFMLQQLNISHCDVDYAHERLESAEKKGPMEYYRQESESVARSFQYHSEADGEEIERTSVRNQWIADLRSSLEPA